MNTEYNSLLEEFKKISNKQWIKSVTKNHGGVGLTFEKELNKTPDSFYFPDYKGIELKCTTRFSRYPIYLFTIAFDGPSFPEINRLIDLYGESDKDFPDKKVLFARINNFRSNKKKSKYIFRLKREKSEEKIYLEVYDRENNLIEKKSFVYLSSLYNHLLIKIQYMAIIYASKRKIDNQDYFRYYKIIIYKLKSFDQFLNLLNNGDIIVDLIARISKSGTDKGKYRNKNLVFSIRKYNIDHLFEKIYEYDEDE